MAVLVIVAMLSSLLALQDEGEGEVAVVTWHWCRGVLLEVCIVLIIIATLLLLLALQDEDKGE